MYGGYRAEPVLRLHSVTDALQRTVAFDYDNADRPDILIASLLVVGPGRY